MQLFVSYSRRDYAAVQVLAADLERTRSEIWMDRELGGGEDWWNEILRRIRNADVFVFAVSTQSLRSRPCLAELEYAIALGIPLLPVQIDQVESFRLSPVAEKQVLDYRARITTTTNLRALAQPAIDLAVAAADLGLRRRSLPDPLPQPPPIPYEYLMQIRIAVDAEEIPSRVQLGILTQLKQALREEDDVNARRDIIDLLQRLRRHPDTTYRNATEVDELLAAEGQGVLSDGNEANLPLTERRIQEPEQVVIDQAVDDEPAGSAGGATKPTQGTETVWSSPPTGLLLILGATLGGIGIGQFGSLFVYHMGDIFTTRPEVGPPFLTASMLVLILTIGGLAMTAVAARRRERWCAIAGTVALTGTVIAFSALVRYWQWW